MKKTYEKPIVDSIEFELIEEIMESTGTDSFIGDEGDEGGW